MGKVFEALEKADYDINGFGDNNSNTEVPPEEQDRQAEGSSLLVDEKIIQETETRGNWDERLDAVNAYSSHLSESFRMLRSRILYPDDGSKPPKTILITSSAPGEGKSFVAANLGIVIAQGVDQHAMCVGCDLRKPALAKLFGMSSRYGLADYLQDLAPLDKLIQPTSVEGLSLLPAGRPPNNPAELLGSWKMKQLVQELSKRYDDRYIVFDSPPMQAVSETLVLTRQVDGVVLVVHWGGSNKSQVKKLVENIGRNKIIGVVFNGFKSNIIESKVLGGYGAPYKYE